MNEDDGDGALRPKKKAVTCYVRMSRHEGANRVFHLKRPGFGGLGRLSTRLARSASNVQGYEGSRVLDALFGGGIEMSCVVAEYLDRVDSSALPDDGGWKRKPESPGSRPGGDWDMEAVDPAEMAVVGKEALAFHRTFCGVDAAFGLIGSSVEDIEAGVGDPQGVPSTTPD